MDATAYIVDDLYRTYLVQQSENTLPELRSAIQYYSQFVHDPLVVDVAQIFSINWQTGPAKWRNMTCAIQVDFQNVLLPVTPDVLYEVYDKYATILKPPTVSKHWYPFYAVAAGSFNLPVSSVKDCMEMSMDVSLTDLHPLTA